MRHLIFASLFVAVPLHAQPAVGAETSSQARRDRLESSANKEHFREPQR